MVEPRPGGRPRSESARRAIIDAALTQLQEEGYAALTIEGIASRAGVGKQTIYRWWRTKADVVMEGILDLAAARIPVPDTGTLEGDLTAFCEATFRQHRQRPALVGLMAEALLDPVFAREFREQFLYRRRAALRGVLERAAERDELRDETDIELALDVVFGVLWYRVLVGHLPLGARVGREVATLLLAGLARRVG